jgi:hypothetical protein
MSIWLAQVILAALFLLHGLLLLALPAPMRRQMASLLGGPRFFRFICSRVADGRREHRAGSSGY